MFVCLGVCLSVCLFVCIMKKVAKDFPDDSQHLNIKYGFAHTHTFMQTQTPTFLYTHAYIEILNTNIHWYLADIHCMYILITSVSSVSSVSSVCIFWYPVYPVFPVYVYSGIQCIQCNYIRISSVSSVYSNLQVSKIYCGVLNLSIQTYCFKFGIEIEIFVLYKIFYFIFRYRKVP